MGAKIIYPAYSICKGVVYAIWGPNIPPDPAKYKEILYAAILCLQGSGLYHLGT